MTMMTVVVVVVHMCTTRGACHFPGAQCVPLLNLSLQSAGEIIISRRQYYMVLLQWLGLNV